MKHLLIQPDFVAWRDAARESLRLGYLPEELDLQDAVAPMPLALSLSTDEGPSGAPIPSPHVPRAFLKIAEFAAAHREPTRWNLLYRLLYRLQKEHDLLHMEADPDVDQTLRLEGQVRRDLHKMQAFVTFKKVLEKGEPTRPEGRPIVIDESVLVAAGGRELSQEHHLLLSTLTPFGVTKTEVPECSPAAIHSPEAEVHSHCEHFIAWYQPDHRILKLAAPFFMERFAVLRWSILTPEDSVSWDPITRQLIFSPGLPHESSPTEDELEGLWRTYYANIFSYPVQTSPNEAPTRR